MEKKHGEGTWKNKSSIKNNQEWKSQCDNNRGLEIGISKQFRHSKNENATTPKTNNLNSMPESFSDLPGFLAEFDQPSTIAQFVV